MAKICFCGFNFLYVRDFITPPEWMHESITSLKFYFFILWELILNKINNSFLFFCLLVDHRSKNPMWFSFSTISQSKTPKPRLQVSDDLLPSIFSFKAYPFIAKTTSIVNKTWNKYSNTDLLWK